MYTSCDYWYDQAWVYHSVVFYLSLFFLCSPFSSFLPLFELIEYFYDTIHLLSWLIDCNCFVILVVALGMIVYIFNITQSILLQVILYQFAYYIRILQKYTSIFPSWPSCILLIETVFFLHICYNILLVFLFEQLNF